MAKFNDLEIQQIYGLTDKQIKDSNIQQILLGFETFETIEKKRKVEEILFEKKL